MIILKEVTKIFGGKTVLDCASLAVNPGEYVCIVGASGAGKSTLLSLLIGAQQPSSGSVEIDGADLRSLPPPILQLYRRRVGMVFQDERLIPHRTVAENCAFPLEACGWNDRDIHERVADVLALFGITSLAAALPELLSAGERARVAVARAVIHEPMILLLDEPTGNLDPELTKETLRLFKQLKELGTTIILATQDLPLAQSIPCRMVELKNGKLTEVVPAGSSAQTAKHDILSATPTGAEADTKRKIKVTMIHS